MTPIASICIPTFNGSAWLEACLESALAQTVADAEILIVDDGSTDATVTIARDFAARDDRVVVEASEQRVGLAKNWNRCVARSRGQWIKFLFQDDVLEPACLERMLEVATSDVPLVICDRRVEVSDCTPPGVRDYFAGLPRMDDLFGPVDRVTPEQVGHALIDHPGVNFFGEPSSMLVHRDAFARFGEFNPRMIQLCDLEFQARVASGTGLARVREELATFRVHAQSASAANLASQEFRKDVLDPLILFHEFAFAPAFAELRRVAAGKRPRASLSALAARQLARAKADVRRNTNLRPELDAVLADHPKLSRPLWRLWHKVRKQLI